MVELDHSSGNVKRVSDLKFWDVSRASTSVKSLQFAGACFSHFAERFDEEASDWLGPRQLHLGNSVSPDVGANFT